MKHYQTIILLLFIPTLLILLMLYSYRSNEFVDKKVLIEMSQPVEEKATINHPIESVVGDFDERCTTLQDDIYLSCKTLLVFDPQATRKHTVAETSNFINGLLVSNGIDEKNIEILFEDQDTAPQALITVAYGEEKSVGSKLQSILSEYVVAYKLVEIVNAIE